LCDTDKGFRRLEQRGGSLWSSVVIFRRAFQGERTRSIKEKGWQVVTVSLCSIVLKKVAQLVVKLLDRAESKAVGMVKSPLPLGEVLTMRFDGGAEVVLVASPWWAGGMDDATDGGSRVSIKRGFHAGTSVSSRGSERSADLAL